MVEASIFDNEGTIMDQLHLYMLLVMAREKHGYPRKRKIRIGYALARSPAHAYTEIYHTITAEHFPKEKWSTPYHKVEILPFSRIEAYREKLKTKERVVQLTFLFGYAAFHSRSAVLHEGTVIARSEEDARSEVTLRFEGSGKPLEEHEALSFMRVPTGFIIDANPSREDPLTAFRKKFPNILKR